MKLKIMTYNVASGRENGISHDKIDFLPYAKTVKEYMLSSSPVIDVIEMRRDYRAQLRFAHKSKYGSILLTEKCRNINIHNIIFEDLLGGLIKC